jgi:hypothetical protein
MAKAKKKSAMGRVAETVKKRVIKPVGKALGLTGRKKGGAKKRTAKRGGAKKR